MFNGIILNTGIVRNITRKKNSTYVEIQTNINFKRNRIFIEGSCRKFKITLDCRYN